jgi:hypothetical protein
VTDVEELSWMVLPDRHPVLAVDGSEAGYAASVLGDAQFRGTFDSAHDAHMRSTTAEVAV